MNWVNQIRMCDFYKTQRKGKIIRITLANLRKIKH